jgi:hypothetical protein
MSETAFEVAPRLLGEYGVLGGTIFYVDWTPNPRQVEGSFLWLANYFENTAYPLVFSMMVAQEDTRERFRTETDLYGGEWAELDPDYKREKVEAGYPEDILHREGYLEEDAPFGWKVIGEALIYDTSGLPKGPSGANYGVLHHTGAGDPSNIGVARESRETARAQRAITTFLTEEEKGGPIKGGVEVGRGRALPARPWIGLSPEAVEEVAFVFSKWFEKGIDDMPWYEPEPLAPTSAMAEARVISRLPSGQPILRIPGVGVRFGRKGS